MCSESCFIPVSIFCSPYDVADNHYFFQGLFPAILNLASNAHISTNATCGEKGPEMFCKLVEHVPGRPLRNAQCRVCDHHSANPKGKFYVGWGFFYSSFFLVSWVCVILFDPSLLIQGVLRSNTFYFQSLYCMSETPFEQRADRKHEHLKLPLSTTESNDSLFVWGHISAFFHTSL